MMELAAVNGENKRAHLQMIQAIISRLAQDSFLIKGWAVTLAAAFLGFAVESENPWLGLLALASVLILWTLDGTFLCNERLFRAHYEEVCNADEANINFSMKPSPKAKEQCASYWKACTQGTLCKFHGGLAFCTMVATVLLFIFYLKC